jgi:hypothetical protein
LTSVANHHEIGFTAFEYLVGVWQRAGGLGLPNKSLGVFESVKVGLMPSKSADEQL